jgi:hypothetical protein
MHSLQQGFGSAHSYLSPIAGLPGNGDQYLQAHSFKHAFPYSDGTLSSLNELPHLVTVPEPGPATPPTFVPPYTPTFPCTHPGSLSIGSLQVGLQALWHWFPHILFSLRCRSPVHLLAAMSLHRVLAALPSRLICRPFHRPPSAFQTSLRMTTGNPRFHSISPVAMGWNHPIHAHILSGDILSQTQPPQLYVAGRQNLN